ncbi:nitrate- and nitrite sensing domain-containing protein [Streptomyces tricolor]|nr:nitrate- and nitrite sensing domain-containing protein [Streptomyces tricolor]
MRQSQRIDAELAHPVAAAVTALQAERTAAVRYATDPRAGNGGDLEELAARTDRAVAKLRLGRHSTVADSQELPAGVSGRPRRLRHRCRRSPGTLRTAVRGHKAGWDDTYRRYTKTIGAAFAVDGALTGAQQADLASDARVLLEFSRAAEALAQEDALLGSARTGAPRGERLRLFSAAVATRRTLTDTAVADLPAAPRAAWQDLARSDSYTALGAAGGRTAGRRTGCRARRRGTAGRLERCPRARTGRHADHRDGHGPCRRRPCRPGRPGPAQPRGRSRTPSDSPPSPPPSSSRSASGGHSWSNS